MSCCEYDLYTMSNFKALYTAVYPGSIPALLYVSVSQRLCKSDGSQVHVPWISKAFWRCSDTEPIFFHVSVISRSETAAPSIHDTTPTHPSPKPYLLGRQPSLEYLLIVWYLGKNWLVHKVRSWLLSVSLETVSSRRVHPSVQSLSHVRLFATPWTAAHQASLSFMPVSY